MRNLSCFKFLTFSGYVSQNSRTATMNNVLPKGFILPIPLLCDLYVGEPLKIGTDETKEVFLTRAQSALLSLNVSEKGKS